MLKLNGVHLSAPGERQVFPSLCTLLDLHIREGYSPPQVLLAKTAVLKLNGGLGTSMGLEKAKSLLEVKDGHTFLDLIAEQIKYTRTTAGAKVRRTGSRIFAKP